MQRLSAQSLITTADSVSTSDLKLFKPVAQKQTRLQKLRSILQRFQGAIGSWKPVQSLGKTQTALQPDSGSSGEVMLSVIPELQASQQKLAQKLQLSQQKLPQKLVHASIIRPGDVQICKTADGKDWLLGLGSYGMVSVGFNRNLSTCELI